MTLDQSLNPLKRVNSILTISVRSWTYIYSGYLSQSPQAGQFNSYMGIGYVLSEMKLIQVSIPSNGSIQFLREIKMDIIDKIKRGLNPLKRVNSILTGFGVPIEVLEDFVSIPSNGSIQFLRVFVLSTVYYSRVSIPSNGSIQFLLSEKWLDSG